MTSTSARHLTARHPVARWTLRIAGALALVVGTANFLHHVVFPSPPPDPRTFPRPGDRLVSEVEGFEQTLLAVDAEGRVSSELTLRPGAAGPPVHTHAGFSETFEVLEGTLHMEVDGEDLVLGPGERLEIPPGTPHRPHNPGTTKVVVGGTSAMPLTFMACLPQLYAILDGKEAAEGRSIVLQLSVMDPICDTHLAAMPPPVETAFRVVVGPFARALGYRSYYPELSLHPSG